MVSESQLFFHWLLFILFVIYLFGKSEWRYNNLFTIIINFYFFKWNDAILDRSLLRSRPRFTFSFPFIFIVGLKTDKYSRGEKYREKSSKLNSIFSLYHFFVVVASFSFPVGVYNSGIHRSPYHTIPLLFDSSAEFAMGLSAFTLKSFLSLSHPHLHDTVLTCFLLYFSSLWKSIEAVYFHIETIYTWIIASLCFSFLSEQFFNIFQFPRVNREKKSNCQFACFYIKSWMIKKQIFVGPMM